MTIHYVYTLPGAMDNLLRDVLTESAATVAEGDDAVLQAGAKKLMDAVFATPPAKGVNATGKGTVDKSADALHNVSHALCPEADAALHGMLALAVVGYAHNPDPEIREAFEKLVKHVKAEGKHPVWSLTPRFSPIDKVEAVA